MAEGRRDGIGEDRNSFCPVSRLFFLGVARKSSRPEEEAVPPVDKPVRYGNRTGSGPAGNLWKIRSLGTGLTGERTRPAVGRTSNAQKSEYRQKRSYASLPRRPLLLCSPERQPRLLLASSRARSRAHGRAETHTGRLFSPFRENVRERFLRIRRGSVMQSWTHATLGPIRTRIFKKFQDPRIPLLHLLSNTGIRCSWVDVIHK